MQRRLAVLAVVTTVAALGLVPAQAAKPKPKPKPITGSYTVTLAPDPTVYAAGVGCAGQLPFNDQHPFTVPARGTLKLHLSSQDPTGAALDWDLALLDAGGEPLMTSTSATAEEEIIEKFKKAEKVIFQACNIAGHPEATLTYTFTYA